MGLKFRRGTTAQQSGSLAFGEPYVNTTLGTLVIGGATGDIVLSSTGTGSTGTFGVISGSALNITGNAKVDGNLTLGGNITIGDNTADNVTVVASLSSSLIPSTTDTFDLGSPTKQWRDLYLSSASLYINGTQVISTTETDLLFTTDTGQGIKFNELGTDNITLQTVDGNIELKSSGGGDVLLDPTTGIISVKGNVSMQDGTAKFLSSGGNSIHFGNNLVITGSIDTTGAINGLNLSTFSTSVNSRLVSFESNSGGYATTASVNTISASAWGAFQSASAYSASAYTTYAQLAVANTFTANQIVSGSITATGDVVAYSTSDKRHKNNIQLIPNALEKVSKLNGVTWEWNEDVEDVTKLSPKTGLIAQEVQAVLPEVVTERENGFLGLDYSKMVGLLVEAIKEQQTQIHSLTLEIENLKKDNSL
jgi:hypothetical protein